MKQQTLFKNTIYKSLLSFVNILIPAIIGSYIVKLLDIELYGIYNAVYSEFQVFLTIASFGIYTYGVREISRVKKDKEKLSQLFTNLCIISFITNLLICIIYVIYALISSGGITTTLYLLMTIQFFANAIYVEFVNEALDNYKFITLKSIIVKILYMIALIIFVTKPNDITIYAVIVGLTNLANNLISFIYAKRHIKFNFKNIKIKKYIYPLLTIFILSNIELLYSQLDKVMLGKFSSNVSVTMYYIPYYIMGMISSIPYSIINVSIPRLVYILEYEGKKAYLKKLKESISSLLFFIIPMCFGVLVLAKEVILIYAGEKYLAMTSVLIVSCIVRIVISLESIMTNLVTYSFNKQNILLKFSSFGGLINVLLNSMLIVFDVFSPITALITTGVAELILFLLQYNYAYKNLKIKVPILTKQNIIYFVLGLAFIPVSLLIRILNLSFLIELFLIMICCTVLYIVILYIKKDSNLIFMIEKLTSKFRKK